MPEYSGYVPGKDTGINWAEKMSGLGGKVEEAIGTRGRERAAFEETRVTNQEKIDEYEAGSSQSFNDLAFNGATDAKDVMYEWNKAASAGEMTQAEYKKRMNNAMSSWSQFSKTASTFDERHLKGLERQQVDPETGEIMGSGFEGYTNSLNAKEADLKNSKVYFDPKTGKAFLTKQDAEGNIISQIDVRQANNPGNMVDNRLNLGGAVKNGVKNFADWKTAKRGSLGKIDTEEDARQNLAFIESKNALVGSILSNDRAIAGVLKDNSDDNYRFYTTDEEKQELILADMEVQRQNHSDAGMDFNESDMLSDITSKMILTKKDETGVYQPAPTDAQRDRAKEIVATEIEMQTGHKETKTGGRSPGGGGNNNNNNNKNNDGGEIGNGGDFYKELIDAWDRSKDDPKGSAATLSAKTGDATVFTWVTGGLQVSKIVQEDVWGGVDGKQHMGTRDKLVKVKDPIKNLQDLSSYFYSETDAKGQGTADAQMKKGRASWKSWSENKKNNSKDNSKNNQNPKSR